MVLHTCDRMAAGGIHDQLGGGFARYSVDAEWLVPHFEKMLYDNAQLAQLYLDAYLVSGDARLRRGGARHPRLRAARHDASGRRLLFRRRCRQRRARRQVLLLDARRAGEAADAGEFKVAVRYFGITEQGNFVDHSHPQPLPNQNVLSVVDPTLTGPELAAAGVGQGARCWPRAPSACARHGTTKCWPPGTA